MSQNSLAIPDGDGATVLTELRNALSTLRTINSGSAAPTEVEAGMLWLDTSGGAGIKYVYQLQSDGVTWLPLWPVAMPHALAQLFPSSSFQFNNTITSTPSGLVVSDYYGDFAGIRVGATYPTRVQVSESGTYRVAGDLYLASTLAGSLQCQIYKNGSNTNHLTANSVPAAPSAFYYPGLHLYVEIPLVAGDYLEIFGAHTMGGSITMTSVINIGRIK